MKITIETITPKRAEHYLNTNSSNRKLREGWVETLASDMINGNWGVCPVPITFYEDGELADGQHRLWAVVESGKTQKFTVLRGLKRKDGLNIDTGHPRTIVDAGKISGIATDLSTGLVSACSAMARKSGGYRPRLSRAEIMQFVSKHKEACSWACHHITSGRGIRNAVVLSAVAKAWYNEKDKERLTAFCKALQSGFGNGIEDSAAIAIRNYILTSKKNTSSEPEWWDTHLKVQNAIRYFMQYRPLTIIKGIKDEQYPLN